MEQAGEATRVAVHSRGFELRVVVVADAGLPLRVHRPVCRHNNVVSLPQAVEAAFACIDQADGLAVGS